MKNYLHLVFFFFFCNTIVAQKVTLVENGKSTYTIVIPKSPSKDEVDAAKVLKDYIYRIARVTLPIVQDKKEQKKYEILVGRVNRLELPKPNYDSLGKSGLLIQTFKDKLIITGGYEKGVLYGVYTFLDKYLDCRKFTADVTYVPQKSSIVINSINDFQLPSFRFRETRYKGVDDPEFMNWHKLNSFDGKGGNKGEWGYWVHTFSRLLDPKEYGEKHPEYFSYYDGERHPKYILAHESEDYRPEAQLCLTNPDVLEIVCRSLKEAMDKKPEAIYWSVSQNDNINYCRCDNCAALDRKYAAFSPDEKMISTTGRRKYSALGMGSVLMFVNKVAERFPDKR